MDGVSAVTTDPPTNARTIAAVIIIPRMSVSNVVPPLPSAHNRWAESVRGRIPRASVAAMAGRVARLTLTRSLYSGLETRLLRDGGEGVTAFSVN